MTDSIKKTYRMPIIYDVLMTAIIPLNILYVIFSVIKYETFGGKALVGIYLILAIIYVFTITALGIINIAKSFLMYNKGDDIYCVNSMMIFKYGLTIFFVLNFIANILMWLVILVASRGTIIFAFPVVAVIIAFSAIPTWIVSFPGSFYAIQVIRFGVKQEKFDKSHAIMHGILQFIFMLDVLDTIYIAVKKWNRGKKISFVICGFYIIAILAIIIALALIFI